MKKRLLPLLLSTALILPLLCPAAAAEETATRRDLADALYALANRPSVSQTQLYSDLTEADDALHWISSEGYMVGYGSQPYYGAGSGHHPQSVGHCAVRICKRA